MWNPHGTHAQGISSLQRSSSSYSQIETRNAQAMGVIRTHVRVSCSA